MTFWLRQARRAPEAESAGVLWRCLRARQPWNRCGGAVLLSPGSWTSVCRTEWELSVSVRYRFGVGEPVAAEKRAADMFGLSEQTAGVPEDRRDRWPAWR